MTLQRRLVAVLALMLVIGLVVADVVTYASVRSFLYGRADATLGQDEALAFNYLNYEASRGLPVNKDNVSRRVSPDVYVILLNKDHQVIMRRPSGPDSSPDPSPILTKDIPVQHVPFVGDRGVGSGRYAGTFRPDPDAVVLGSTDDPDGEYRAIAVNVPQGTLISSLSLNPTNDTLSSLRKIELFASLAVLLALCVLTTVFVRRGLRPLREMAGTADTIASGDLTRRVPLAQTETKDEVGRLGVALNKMLTQIESAFAEKSASEERLRQFVADASHELRTPLTSIRGLRRAVGQGRLLRRGQPDQGAQANRGGGGPHGRPRRGPPPPGRAGPGPALALRARRPPPHLCRRGGRFGRGGPEPPSAHPDARRSGDRDR